MAYNYSVPIDENKDCSMSTNDDFIYEGVDPDIKLVLMKYSLIKSLSSQNDDYLWKRYFNFYWFYFNKQR